MKNAMSATKSVCGMSCGAMHEFALTLDKAGFDADLVKKIINSGKNEYAKMMYASLVNDPFELINIFEIVVPEDYEHENCLDSFMSEYRTELGCISSIKDKYHTKVSTKLEPGRKFKVKVFQIKMRVTSENCLAYLRRQKAIFVGAQGMTLVWKQKKKELPVEKFSVALEEKESLWKDAHGYHDVTYIYRRSNSDFSFNTKLLEPDLYNEHCLICFCDVNE